MGAAEVDPVLRRSFLPLLTGEVVALLGGGLPRLFVGALTVDVDDAAAAGKTGRQRFGLTTAYPTLFDPPVPAGGLDKKGVSGVRVCAYWSSVGWLALICRKYSPPLSTIVRAVSF